MEKTFPGVKVYIACQESSMYLLEKEERIIGKEELNCKRDMFSYIREISCNLKSHPIEDFMDESDIPCGPIIQNSSKFGNCVLLTSGIFPVKSLTGSQIKQAIQYVEKKGCSIRLNESIEDADWVIGVENLLDVEEDKLGLINIGSSKELSNSCNFCSCNCSCDCLYCCGAVCCCCCAVSVFSHSLNNC